MTMNDNKSRKYNDMKFKSIFVIFSVIIQKLIQNWEKIFKVGVYNE